MIAFDIMDVKKNPYCTLIIDCLESESSGVKKGFALLELIKNNYSLANLDLSEMDLSKTLMVKDDLIFSGSDLSKAKLGSSQFHNG